MLACAHAEIQRISSVYPKGLTSGWLPFSAVLTTDAIYKLFYADLRVRGCDFLHSAHLQWQCISRQLVALETLRILKANAIIEYVNEQLACLYIICKMSHTKLNDCKTIRSWCRLSLAEFNTDNHQRIGFSVSRSL